MGSDESPARRAAPGFNKALQFLHQNPGRRAASLNSRQKRRLTWTDSSPFVALDRLIPFPCG